jgi:hypothetical protein
MNEPKIKYFKPASLENTELRLKLAKIKNDKDCSSIDKYIDKKSDALTNNKVENKENKKIIKYSKKLSL